MTANRKERIMIACVTTETVKVSDPVAYYDATCVHLIHYIRYKDNSQREVSNIYAGFYKEICKTILINNHNTTIKEHNENVDNFSVMLRTILNIIEHEEECDEGREIYVNMSAGTNEYSAAASVAAMMHPGTTLFSVPTVEYTMRKDKILKKAFYSDDVPVGAAKKVGIPNELPQYHVDMPDRNLVLGLRILQDKNDNQLSTTSGQMVLALKNAGLWRNGNSWDSRVTKKKRSNEAVYYQRAYIDKWLKNGWIEKNGSRKYTLTSEGKDTVSSFYTE